MTSSDMAKHGKSGLGRARRGMANDTPRRLTSAEEIIQRGIEDGQRDRPPNSSKAQQLDRRKTLARSHTAKADADGAA